jgi:hypothetical protein
MRWSDDHLLPLYPVPFPLLLAVPFGNMYLPLPKENPFCPTALILPPHFSIALLLKNVLHGRQGPSQRTLRYPYINGQISLVRLAHLVYLQMDNFCFLSSILFVS